MKISKSQLEQIIRQELKEASWAIRDPLAYRRSGIAKVGPQQPRRPEPKPGPVKPSARGFKISYHDVQSVLNALKQSDLDDPLVQLQKLEDDENISPRLAKRVRDELAQQGKL